MIIPILTYGAEIWGYDYSDVIEQIHFKFCKDFLGTGSSVNNTMALGECGRLPIAYHYNVKLI